jgi:hypothetical protein
VEYLKENLSLSGLDNYAQLEAFVEAFDKVYFN